MPTAPTINPVAADSTGANDLTWITRTRRDLEDKPTWQMEQWMADGVNGVAASGSAPVKISFGPINGAIADSTQPSVRDVTGSQNYTVIETGTPTGTQVLVDYDAGSFTFASAPTVSHVLAFGYYSCRWRDQAILDALYDGLRAIFPYSGKVYTDISTQIVTNQWDYQLPAMFADPRSRIISLEIADPYIPTEPFKTAPPGEKRIGLGLLHLPWAQRYSPTARLRIVGWGPYLRLGDLEPQLEQLPLWYALGVLLPKKEAKRIREDSVTPVAGLGGAQPGLHVQTGDYFARRFQLALDALARLPGPSPSRPQATYRQARRY